MWQGAAFIARSELAQLLRRREALLWTFVMPFLFFYFIGVATGGSGVPGMAATGTPIRLMVAHADVDAPQTAPAAPATQTAPAAPAGDDPDPVLDRLIHRLTQDDFVVTVVTDPAAFDQSAPRLLVTVPAGQPDLATAVRNGVQVPVTFHTAAAEGPGADFEQLRIMRAVYTVVADIAATAGGEPVNADAFAELDALPRTLAIDEKPAGQRRHVPSGYEQAVPGMLVMFTMLVLLTVSAQQLAVERREGLLRRLATAPIPRRAVVLGKWTGRMAVGMIQIGFAMLAGSLFFGMRWGAELPMVALVLLAWAAFNASLGLWIGTVTRTEAQATGIGLVLTMLFAALGGCWWPLEIAPGWMQTLGLALPSGWTMDAIHKLAIFAHPATSAVPHLLALVAAALVFGAMAVRKFRYQ